MKNDARSGMTIVVIVPTLNEETLLRRAICSVPEGCRVVVSDGGSNDRTVAIANELNARVIEGAHGRASQMNRAAKILSGEVLVFLHADGALPPDAAAQIRQVMADPETIGGAFRLAVEGANSTLGWITRVANLRSRWLKLPYGDQALFVRRDCFERVGGFPDIPIMEDVAFVRALRRIGKLAIVSSAVTNTARHWTRRGAVYTTLVNWTAIMAYNLGVDPKRIAPWYARRRESPESSDTASPSEPLEQPHPAASEAERRA